MKILQIAPYFPPYPGGQEKYVYYLSRALVKNGHQVTVLTSNYPPRKSFEIVDGIHIYRFPHWGRPLRNPITPTMIYVPPHISFDIIHAHNEHSFAANVAVVVKKYKKKPLVLTHHGQLTFSSTVADLFCKLYEETFSRIVFNNADQITVAVPSEKEHLLQRYKLKDRIEIVPVGIDLGDWDISAHPIPKNPWEGKKIVLVATQLIKRKGIHFLIQAWPNIIAHHPDTMLLIAGTGQDEKWLKQMVIRRKMTSSIVFMGNMDRHSLAAIYAIADVFVLPSLSEGQPTCILEAWAFAKPVVATAIDGIKDYYSDAAILVEPANPQALAKAINYLLENPLYGHELGKRGKTLIKDFQWEHLLPKMLMVYTKALARV